MSKNAKFNLWMLIIAVGSMLTHYIILWTLKYDELIFLFLAFAAVSAIITGWIFARFERK